MFRLKGRAKMDVFQELFEELAKYAGARGPGGKPVQVVDSEALRALPRALCAALSKAGRAATRPSRIVHDSYTTPGATAFTDVPVDLPGSHQRRF